MSGGDIRIRIALLCLAAPTDLYRLRSAVPAGSDNLQAVVSGPEYPGRLGAAPVSQGRIDRAGTELSQAGKLTRGGVSELGTFLRVSCSPWG